jgi:hypothetical protein
MCAALQFLSLLYTRVHKPEGIVECDEDIAYGIAMTFAVDRSDVEGEKPLQSAAIFEFWIPGRPSNASMIDLEADGESDSASLFGQLAFCAGPLQTNPRPEVMMHVSRNRRHSR